LIPYSTQNHLFRGLDIYLSIPCRLDCDNSIEHYRGFVEIHGRQDAIWRQFEEALVELADSNVSIATKLQQVVRQHDQTSLSKKLARDVLLNKRCLGPTFAACGITLDD
jgi:hypothetical protein